MIDKLYFRSCQVLLDITTTVRNILNAVEIMTPNVENISASVNKWFGRQMAEVRMNRKISQSELARRIGKSRITVANLESGRQNVQLHQVFQIARALDVPASELIPNPNYVYADPEIVLSNAFLHLSKSKLQTMLGETE